MTEEVAKTGIKTVHIIGATVLLGTGAGIAFFMVMANRTGDARFVAQTARVVVIADWVFTASAVVLQPLTGGALAQMEGYPVTRGWIPVSLALYVIAGVFWLPVVEAAEVGRRLAARAFPAFTA